MGQAPEGHLPPDLRGRGGVGGGARENLASAQRREAALSSMDESSASPTPSKEESGPVESKPEKIKCSRCSTVVSDDANFCGKCGKDLLTDPIELLGIDFTNEDLDEYLFRGFLVKELKVVGRPLMVRSSLPSDHRKITEYLMEKWSDTPVTQDFWENLRGTAAISLSIVSFDGKEIGDDVDARVEWMMKVGAALHDMLTKKVVLFNRGVTEWLSKKDTFLAS